MCPPGAVNYPKLVSSVKLIEVLRWGVCQRGITRGRRRDDGILPPTKTRDKRRN